MNCLPLLLYLILLLDSVLGSLPAPVNLFVSSANFQHLLRWDPGPGTPPGTHYKIFKSLKKKKMKELSYLNTTSLKLKLRDSNKKYFLTVQACYNQTLCYDSAQYPFTPYSDTTIGPPKVSLAGCGNCIHINISLPEADRSSGINDIQAYYSALFRVSWRKPKEAVVSKVTSNKSYTLNNLQIGTEYCVQVDTEINVNTNTEPSAWKCTFTSIVKPSRDPAILGAVAVLLFLVIVALVSSMYCLHYIGFLCKLKATPRILIEVLRTSHTLVPDRTIPDKISITAETEKHNNPTTPQPATWGTNSDEEDEEEEEEEEHIYMDREAELSLVESSCQGSVDVSRNCKVTASGGSESLTLKEEGLYTEFEFETYEELDQDEAKAEAEEVSFMPEGDQTEVQGQVTGEEEEEKEEGCESSAHINLFSVTLAALAVYEEGEEEEEQNTEDSLIDFSKLSDLEPFLPTGSQTESDDWTTVPVVPPTQKDFNANGYEGRCADTVSDCLKTCDGETQHEETEENEEEEEEEEEEFSGYMRHT